MCSSTLAVLVRYWLQLEFNCGAPAMAAVWPRKCTRRETELEQLIVFLSN